MVHHIISRGVAKDVYTMALNICANTDNMKIAQSR
jgi:hypothetical protein